MGHFFDTQPKLPDPTHGWTQLTPDSPSVLLKGSIEVWLLLEHVMKATEREFDRRIRERFKFMVYRLDSGHEKELPMHLMELRIYHNLAAFN